MKKIILSLALLGSFGMIQAQNSFQVEPAYASTDAFEVSEASNVLRSVPTNEFSISNAEANEYKYSSLDDNIEYLTEVKGETTPISVRKYQLMASLYDVSESYIFDARNEPFQMVFKTEKGTITTTYDWNGEVLTSEEKFHNVALPSEVLRNVLADYVGWEVVKTNYEVSYIKDRKATQIYTVQITNGKKKKKISMDAEGAVI